MYTRSATPTGTCAPWVCACLVNDIEVCAYVHTYHTRAHVRHDAYNTHVCRTTRATWETRTQTAATNAQPVQQAPLLPHRTNQARYDQAQSIAQAITMLPLSSDSRTTPSHPPTSPGGAATPTPRQVATRLRSAVAQSMLGLPPPPPCLDLVLVHPPDAARMHTCSEQRHAPPAPPPRRRRACLALQQPHDVSRRSQCGSCSSRELAWCRATPAASSATNGAVSSQDKSSTAPPPPPQQPPPAPPPPPPPRSEGGGRPRAQGCGW